MAKDSSSNTQDRPGAVRLDLEEAYETALELKVRGAAELAARHLRRAAEAGHAGAQYEYALALYYGTGVERDVQSAQHWWRAAARQGHAHAAYFIGGAPPPKDREMNTHTRTHNSTHVVMLKVSGARLALARADSGPGDAGGGAYTIAVDGVPGSVSPGVVCARVAALNLRWPITTRPADRRLAWDAIAELAPGATVP